jgi:hypothetical protein
MKWYTDNTGDWPDLKTWPFEKEPKQECLHDNCSNCGGPGQRKDGLGFCVHMISCPCPKCRPRC